MTSRYTQYKSYRSTGKDNASIPQWKVKNQGGIHQRPAIQRTATLDTGHLATSNQNLNFPGLKRTGSLDIGDNYDLPMRVRVRVRGRGGYNTQQHQQNVTHYQQKSNFSSSKSQLQNQNQTRKKQPISNLNIRGGLQFRKTSTGVSQRLMNITAQLKDSLDKVSSPRLGKIINKNPNIPAIQNIQNIQNQTVLTPRTRWRIKQNQGEVKPVTPSASDIGKKSVKPITPDTDALGNPSASNIGKKGRISGLMNKYLNAVTEGDDSQKERVLSATLKREQFDKQKKESVSSFNKKACTDTVTKVLLERKNRKIKTVDDLIKFLSSKKKQTENEENEEIQDGSIPIPPPIVPIPIPGKVTGPGNIDGNIEGKIEEHINSQNSDTLNLNNEKFFQSLDSTQKPTVYRTFCQNLADDQTKKKFSASQCGLNNQFAVEFAETIARNTTLEEVILDNNEIGGPQAFDSIGKAISKNNTITSFHIRSQKYSSHEGELDLLIGLEANHSIIKFGFDFGKREFTERKDKVLRRNAEENRKKKRMTSFEDQETAKECDNISIKTTKHQIKTPSKTSKKTMNQLQVIIHSLKNSNCTIENLNLSDYRLQFLAFSKEEKISLAQAISENSSIFSLAIRDCNVGDDFAKALASSISLNNTLLELDISANQIGDIGMCAIINALINNKTICTLKIDQKRTMGRCVDTSLATMMKQNEIITKLGFTGWKDRLSKDNVERKLMNNTRMYGYSL